MTISTSPLSKLFNLLAPSRVSFLNRELWAHASKINGGVDERQLWKDILKLLRAGAEIDAKSPTGDTALNLLCDQRHGYAASQLLMHGADLTIANDAGHTPFLTAARVGDPDMLKLLIAHKADVNQLDSTGDNAAHLLLYSLPLGHAAEQARIEKRIEALKILVEAGVPLNKGCQMRIYHHSPVYLPSVPEVANVHALGEAIKEGVPFRAQAIIESGVHPDATAEFGDQSTLAFGAGVGDIALIDASLKAGANINLTSGDARATALQVAVMKGQREAFLHLLDAGANPSQPSSRFDAPQLYNAAKECADPTMLKFVTDTLHDRAKDGLVLQKDVKDVAVKVIRFKTSEPRT